jgi:RIO-like serine/threonine protein kinase
MLLCDALGVKEHHTERSGGELQSFLGRGRSGRTFVVVDSEGSVCALKVVVSEESFHKTSEEFGRLVVAGERLPDRVVRVKRGSLREGRFDIATVQYFYQGYLMEDVGTPVSALRLTTPQCEQICRALNALHINEIFHGDARVPNVVLCDGRFKWIDFHPLVGASAGIGATRDVKELIDSFCWGRGSVAWPNFADLLQSYVATLDVEHVLAILHQTFTAFT